MTDAGGLAEAHTAPAAPRLSPAPRRYSTFGMLRGLAAVTVATDHVARHLGVGTIHRGYLAVDLFFVLSGFILSAAYGARLGRTVDVSGFLARRIVRVYPLFLVGMGLGLLNLIAALALGASKGRPLEAFAQALLPNTMLLPDLSDLPRVFPLNGPMWSLFFELSVNILYAVWLVRLRTRSLVVVLALCAVVVATLAIGFGTVNLGWDRATLAGGCARAMFGFVAGMLVARAPLPRLGARTGVSLAAGVGVVAMLVLAAPAAWELPVEIACVLVVAPALVLVAATVEVPAALAGLAFAAGEISFPLYCIHFPLITVAGMIGGFLHLPVPLTIAAYVCACIALARVLLIRFDKPVRRRLSASLSRNAARHIAA